MMARSFLEGEQGGAGKVETKFSPPQKNFISILIYYKSVSVVGEGRMLVEPEKVGWLVEPEKVG